MAAGETQSEDQVAAFVAGVVDGSVTRPQAAAWLAFAYARGLSPEETVALTRSMTTSGLQLTWPDGPPLIDKHSTGGVGDKVSLVLAPLWAELGNRVPMLSGRGLGHTGGTLDKLESIDGFRTDLSREELGRLLEEVGCFITGQTPEIAPADRVLYALRDETRTIASIPLIVGSILSKKLAAGVERLVLDVKTGSGAFMRQPEDALALARALVHGAKDAGVACTAFVTEMGRPLGRAVGNRLEVIEAVATLQGEGPDDLRDLTLVLADDPDAEAILSSGRAYERFARMAVGQGADAKALEGIATATADVQTVMVECDRAGIVHRVDAREVGMAAFALGAGRRHGGAAVDRDVGLLLHAVPGDVVAPGDPLMAVVHRDGHGLEEANERIRAAILIEDEPPDLAPMVHHAVGV